MSQYSSAPTHTCLWTGCTRQIATRLWACQQHWFKLPLPLRRRILKAYDPVARVQSAEHAAATKAALEWIAAQEKAAA